MIECSFGPSGVPSCSLPIQARYCGSSLMMENGSQVSPPSSERNSPCGEVPAYQAFGSLAWHGREPERVIDRAALSAPSGALAKAGGLRGFLPGAAEIRGAEHGRAEVAGLGRRQQRAPVARVEHQMIDDVAEKVRPVGAPGLALRIAVKQPRALARGDEHHAPGAMGEGVRQVWNGRWLSCFRVGDFLLVRAMVRFSSACGFSSSAGSRCGISATPTRGRAERKTASPPG